jgi:DNA primase
MIDHHRRISAELVPHLQERPLTLKRYPDGVNAELFHEKRCPSHRRPSIATCPIPRRGGTGKPTFEAADVIERVRRLGDLFEPVRSLQHELPRLG